MQPKALAVSKRELTICCGAVQARRMHWSTNSSSVMSFLMSFIFTKVGQCLLLVLSVDSPQIVWECMWVCGQNELEVCTMLVYPHISSVLCIYTQAHTHILKPFEDNNLTELKLDSAKGWTDRHLFWNKFIEVRVKTWQEAVSFLSAETWHWVGIMCVHGW